MKEQQKHEIIGYIRGLTERNMLTTRNLTYILYSKKDDEPLPTLKQLAMTRDNPDREKRLGPDRMVARGLYNDGCGCFQMLSNLLQTMETYGVTPTYVYYDFSWLPATIEAKKDYIVSRYESMASSLFEYAKRNWYSTYVSKDDATYYLKLLVEHGMLPSYLNVDSMMETDTVVFPIQNIRPAQLFAYIAEIRAMAFIPKLVNTIVYLHKNYKIDPIVSSVLYAMYKFGPYSGDMHYLSSSYMTVQREKTIKGRSEIVHEIDHKLAGMYVERIKRFFAGKVRWNELFFVMKRRTPREMYKRPRYGCMETINSIEVSQDTKQIWGYINDEENS